MTEHNLPVIRLRPKTDSRPLRRGAPWVYANEAVLDRRTKGLSLGTLAVLEDADRAPIALVGVNPKSKIVARVLDRDPGAKIDEAWFTDRLTTALQLRERLFDQPFYRLVHAEWGAPSACGRAVLAPWPGIL